MQEKAWEIRSWKVGDGRLEMTGSEGGHELGEKTPSQDGMIS
jgi:hypothetical protein